MYFENCLFVYENCYVIFFYSETIRRRSAKFCAYLHVYDYFYTHFFLHVHFMPTLFRYSIVSTRAVSAAVTCSAARDYIVVLIVVVTVVVFITYTYRTTRGNLHNTIKPLTTHDIFFVYTLLNYLPYCITFL